MPRPKIKHIAILCKDTEATAAFYQKVFQMEVLRVGPARPGMTRSVYLTDGYLNLALLPHAPSRPDPGINHFGFEVDDVASVSSAMTAAGVAAPKESPSDRAYAEFRGSDPEGNRFDLSAHGYQVAETAGERARR